MLVMVRLFPKGGLNGLCNTLENGKRNFFWRDVEPLYAIRQEGKEYISVLLDVKNLDAMQNVFLKNIETMAAVNKVRTVPVMSPIYFPPPQGHPADLERHLAFLRVTPEKYEEVYNNIMELAPANDSSVAFLSQSYGDDDMIVSLLSKDRESARQFMDSKIRNIEGVLAYDVSKVVGTIKFLPEDKMKAHKDRFVYSVPAGQKGDFNDLDANKKYNNEDSPLITIVRIFAKNDMESLWTEIEEKASGFESGEITPLYASQQENKDYISMVFYTKNFEVLNTFIDKQMGAMNNVIKTRTVPMLEPTYMLLPKDHPPKMARFLVTMQVDPRQLQTVRSRLVTATFPKNMFLTYISYSTGKEDILFSVLAENREAVRTFTKEKLENMSGVLSYDISNQLKTKRLASPERWKVHQTRFLSDYDRYHHGDYDTEYDWSNDVHEYAMLTGAFSRDMND